MKELDQAKAHKFRDEPDEERETGKVVALNVFDEAINLIEPLNLRRNEITFTVESKGRHCTEQELNTIWIDLHRKGCCYPAAPPCRISN